MSSQRYKGAPASPAAVVGPTPSSAHRRSAAWQVFVQNQRLEIVRTDVECYDAFKLIDLPHCIAEFRNNPTIAPAISAFNETRLFWPGDGFRRP